MMKIDEHVPGSLVEEEDPPHVPSTRLSVICVNITIDLIGGGVRPRPGAPLCVVPQANEM